jgi:Na+/H+ antiporter NhaD/arsenite permease-like protein
MILAGIVVIAANAGGAFSPIGDVTTTLLMDWRTSECFWNCKSIVFTIY